MPIYKWICPNCRGAYILPRQSKHRYNHWRCYSCDRVFHVPREIGTMGMDDSFYLPLIVAERPDNWAHIVESYKGPYKFPDDMMMYPERPRKRKRRRATVIAEQDGNVLLIDGNVLLIKEKGANRYSLPGGGIERDESFMEAAVRELREETKLIAVKTEYLFDHEGTTQYHKVIWALVRGSVRIQRKELAEHKWWNTTDNVSMIDSATVILDKHLRGAYR